MVASGALTGIIHMLKLMQGVLTWFHLIAYYTKTFSSPKLWRVGINGVSTFSGKKAGVQSRTMKGAAHALFVHGHCHL